MRKACIQRHPNSEWIVSRSYPLDWLVNFGYYLKDDIRRWRGARSVALHRPRHRRRKSCSQHPVFKFRGQLIACESCQDAAEIQARIAAMQLFGKCDSGSGASPFVSFNVRWAGARKPLS